MTVMKNDKLEMKHPRLAIRYMKNFIEQAMDEELTFSDNIPYEVALKKDSNFCAYLTYSSDFRVVIGYNFEKYSHDKAFRKNFIARCPLARGFASITLTLLHELGHFETEDYISDEYDRDKALIEIRKRAKEESPNLSVDELNEKYYFPLEDETLATDWAIEWLQDKNNRKIAKQFEKNFFSCVKKD